MDPRLCCSLSFTTSPSSSLLIPPHSSSFLLIPPHPSSSHLIPLSLVLKWDLLFCSSPSRLRDPSMPLVTSSPLSYHSPGSTFLFPFISAHAFSSPLPLPPPSPQELPPHQREDAVASLEYEAQARVQDPVYGCVGILCVLQVWRCALESIGAMACLSAGMALHSCASPISAAGACPFALQAVLVRHCAAMCSCRHSPSGLPICRTCEAGVALHRRSSSNEDQSATRTAKALLAWEEDLMDSCRHDALHCSEPKPLTHV